MSSTKEEREVRKTSPFADDVAEEGALEIDEEVVGRSVSLDPPFVSSFDVAKRKGAECVRRALEQLSSEAICGMKPVLGADDDGDDSFVDVVGGGQRDEGAESEGFTFADALIRANRLSETVLESVVSSCELPLCYSSFFISVSFSYRSIIVAILIVLKLVFSARPNKKMASWGYCVLVYDSAGEPAAPPGNAFAVVLGCSGIEFKVGCATSCDDVPSLEKRSPMGCASSL